MSIDSYSIRFFGCNKNTGTINSDDYGKFKVISWDQTDKKNTCEVDNDEKIKGEFNRVVEKD